MSKLKYIVDKYGNIAIFSAIANHSDVARSIPNKPIAAGFVQIDLGGPSLDKFGSAPVITCYGESTTLKLESRGEVDAEVIFKAFNDPSY